MPLITGGALHQASGQASLQATPTLAARLLRTPGVRVCVHAPVAPLPYVGIVMRGAEESERPQECVDVIHVW